MTATSTKTLLDVAPAIPLPVTSAQTYTYHVAEGSEAPEVYTMVEIPFGRRTVSGVVQRVYQGRVPYPTKAATSFSTFQLTANQVAFAQWIHVTMQGGLGFTQRLFFPTGRAAVSQASPATLPALVSPQAPGVPMAVLQATMAARVKQYRQYLLENIEANGQSVIIVPEVWMVEAVLTELQLPADIVARGVHSELTARAYATVWQAARAGEVRVVVGTQKALFLPFPQLGLVVVEQEGLPTHKLWDQYPRLHNVLGSEEVAQLHQAQLVYGSPFPSVRLSHLQTTKKVMAVQPAPLAIRPTILEVGRDKNKEQKQWLLPPAFVTSLKGWLKRKERVVILHNARGSWQTMICTVCQYVPRCPECGSASSVHTGKKSQLVCHHCSTTQPLPDKCPKCKKGKMRVFGAGLDKVAEVLREILPAQASLLTVEAASAAKVQLPPLLTTGVVLLGTSALFSVVKAEQVDRAVFLFPERSLLYPDYRSTERTYLLTARLTSLLPPRRQVVLVTRKARLVQDELGVAGSAWTKRQLRARERQHYPPWRDAVQLTVRERTAEAAQEQAERLRAVLDQRIAKQKNNDVAVRGPYTSFLRQRQGQHERHLLLLGDLEALRTVYAGIAADVIDVWPERIL